MGIALAAGALLGVRAAGADSLFLVIATIVVTAAALLLVPASIRTLLLCLLGGCVIGWGAGSVRAGHAEPTTVDVPGSVSGTIADDPRSTASGAIARVRWTPADGTTIDSTILLPPVPDVARSDRVLLVMDTDHGAAELPVASSMVLTQRPGGLEALRRRLRDGIEARIDAHVPGAAGALALGLLIGDDSGLSNRERDDLRAAGLSHITAVSGSNVSLVVTLVASVFAALRLFGRGWLVVQVSALGGYVWLVGGAPPVIRAAIMCCAVLVAQQLGRPAHATTLLLLTAADMLCITPSLYSSLSFQLTIAATAGLVAAATLTRRFDRGLRVLVVPLATSLFAGLATAPLLALAFGTVAPATIPANIICGPLVPLMTVGTLLLIALSPVPLLADIAGTGVWAAGELLLRIAHVLAGMLGTWTVAPLSPALSAGIFTVLLLLALSVSPEGRAIRRLALEWSSAAPDYAVAALVTWTCVLLAGAALV